MNVYDILARRAVGELPLSIGTSLAMETLEPNKRYGGLWINIRTLYRNIYDALDGEDRKALVAALGQDKSNRTMREAVVAFTDTLEEELQRILQYGQGKLDKVTLYHREYADLLRRFPGAILFTPKTPLQKTYHFLMDNVIDEVLRRPIGQYVDFGKGSQLKGEPVKALILTHYPVDLLSRTEFIQLRLIESYSGAIKSKSQWNTKLTDGKLYPRIPFNEFTIQAFGDRNILFMRYPKSVREAVLELAERFKWTTMTTTDKIKLNLGWMNDRYTAEQLKRLL